MGLIAASCAQMESKAPPPAAAAPQEEVLTNGSGVTLYVYNVSHVRHAAKP